MFRASFFFLVLIPLAAQDKIDFVKLGSETFQAVGCAECHSIVKNDTAAKTGPALYGLFQKTPRKRTVVAGGEQHRVVISADFKYLTKSLSQPHEELAVAENGPTKGRPYLPVMPPYDAAFISEFKAKAIYQYLLTLNDKDQRGPARRMVKDERDAETRRPEQNSSEVLVTDRTRAFRARLKGSSARAVYIGTPAGLNYSFDPVSLSLERIWWGGYLNLKEEQTGRGGKYSRLGEHAIEVHGASPLFSPLDPATGKAVDLSFKSPRIADYKTIAKNLNSKVDFSDQLKGTSAKFLGYQNTETPSFQFTVGRNVIDLQFTVTVEGKATILLTGELKEAQTFLLSPFLGQGETLTVKSLPTTISFTLPVQPAWRPVNVTSTESQRAVYSEVSKVNLPRGFEAQQIAAPLDIHGRSQLFEPLGIDETSDGRLIMATRTAGVWQLHQNQWKMIAEGMLDSLGVIAEEDGSLVIGHKPELARLRDRDRDGWYETYEILSADFFISGNYHEYLHGPAKDTEGNYYFALNLAEHNQKEAIHKANGKYMGAQGGYRGWAFKVTPEGFSIPIANGLRSPAGLAMGPDGKLYYTENQGEYVGTSKLFVLEKGNYYGHPSGLVDLPGMTPSSPEIDWKKFHERKEKAIALIAQSRLANSAGSPAWAPESFGAFAGEMFVGDQTLSCLFRILPKDNHEAALFPFAHGFPSGVMRPIFTQNGMLVLGQTGRGWRAKGGSEHALVTIKQSRESPEPQVADLIREGFDFTIQFTSPFKGEVAAEDLEIHSWTMSDSPKYGSPENDQVKHTIKSLVKAGDGMSVKVAVDQLPAFKKNTLIRFSSKKIPVNKGKMFEAFYTVTVR